MRPGYKRFGQFIPAQVETVTVVDQQAYLDAIAALVALGFSVADARIIYGDNPQGPFEGGEWRAAQRLYPGLPGFVRDETIIRKAVAAGHYEIRVESIGEGAAPVTNIRYNVLPYWKNAPWTQTLNEPDTLTFDYPVDADHADKLLRPNNISLYDGYGDLVQQFVLRDVIPTLNRDGNEVTVKVNAVSLLARLDDEYVTSYSATGTLATHVAALLSQFQTGNGAIAVGDIYDGLGGTILTVLFEARSILDCIRELHKLIGGQGQYTVTPGGLFVWAQRLGSSNATDVSLGYNLRSLERRHDAADFATRLYVYGAGLTQSTRLVEFREANSATYGSVTKHLTFDDITDQASLSAYADELITVTSVPVLEYSVDAADLYEIGEGPALTLGAAAHVIDTEMGTDATLDVFSIRKSLDHPLDVSYTFAKKQRTLASLIKGINDRIDQIERRNDRTRIETALQAGALDGIARVDPYIDVATERNGDLDVGDRLGYYDEAAAAGAGAWEEVVRYDPGAGDAMPGDLRVGALNGPLEYWDGDSWNPAATGGTDTADTIVDTIVNDATALATLDGALGPQKGTSIQSIGSANAAGSNTTYAADDHLHLIGPLGTDIQAVGAANAAGDNVAVARDDHVHSGPQAGTSVAELAATSAAGSAATWSKSDHAHAGLPRNDGTTPDNGVKVSSGKLYWKPSGGTNICLSHIV